MGILYLTHIVKPVIFINMVTFPPKTGQNELLEQRPLFPHQNLNKSQKKRYLIWEIYCLLFVGIILNYLCIKMP